MTDIQDLERRLAAAMDRIADGIASVSGSGGGDEGLRAALEDEKLANAQLTERIRKLSEQQENAVAQANAAAEAAASRISALDLELQRLRQANAQLRESNAALRVANEAGVGEPHLINKAMMAELEGLRATRAADMAEATAILSALDDALSAHGGVSENA